ncbi:hypothetical protein [Actinomadura mexicana]|uniref:Uncharacterized protein n=1 Tax=Actinomadura mexicana TaxID=134959 RepID=A0A238UWD0_9ACTN|nr:hypothetical protein [Actinomadura mexicana]SNR25643.1 hypothetical protein SAMN06265355_101427 [Actinomadura mexicana]
MRKFVDAVLSTAAGISVSALALYIGGIYGSIIDQANGGLNDPIDDGMWWGTVTAAVALVVGIVVHLSGPYVARINKHRVAARNTRDAARRREEARKDRQYWKRVYWNRTH